MTENLKTALLDANVLYPAPMRDLLVQLAAEDLFRPKWTKKIQREWVEALLRKEPFRSREALERTCRFMNEAAEDCLVSGYEPLIETLDLPDPDDRHVLAAAIGSRCNVIVTRNLKDFPQDRLSPYGLEALHPDAFLGELMLSASDTFCKAVRKIRARLKSPGYTADEYLSILIRQELTRTAERLKMFKEMI